MVKIKIFSNEQGSLKKQTSKQSIKQANKQASKQANKQANKIFNPAQLTAYGGTREGLPQLKLHTIKVTFN